MGPVEGQSYNVHCGPSATPQKMYAYFLFDFLGVLERRNHFWKKKNFLGLRNFFELPKKKFGKKKHFVIFLP